VTLEDQDHKVLVDLWEILAHRVKLEQREQEEQKV